MKNIKSKDNPKIKLLKKLQQAKYRKEFSSFLVENFVIIRDAFFSGIEMEAIFVTESFLQHNKFRESKNKIPDEKIFIIDEKINKYISKLATPSGVIALYQTKEGVSTFKKPTVYLNSISDPGNLGTIFRNCLAFGIKNVICDEGCADIYNEKTISAAKDSIFKLNILKDKNLAVLKKYFKKIPIYATEVNKGISVNNFSFPDNYILVFGSESHGVDRDILNLSDESLNIITSRNIESLNVSSATAIFLYEISKSSL